jgi:hypothetical protein
MPRPQLSFFFSRRSFFEPQPVERSGIDDRGYRSDSNEVETGKYSGSWLARVCSTRILFPAFTVPCGGSRVGCYPKMQAARLPLQRLALGNRIQLQQRNCSRISREFLAPLHDCTDKELLPEVTVQIPALKIYLATRLACPRSGDLKSPTDGGSKPPLLEAPYLATSSGLERCA